MGITPHNRISTKHQKYRGRAPSGCRTIINKREGVTLYQNMCNPWLLIPMPLSTFGKKPGPTGVTPTMLLWILPDQDSTRDLSNAKQMGNKNNPYLENIPGRSLPSDTCKRNNRVDIHLNTHSLRLFPPEEKQTSWVNDIKICISFKTIKTDTLELLIGELNHAECFILPEWYFLNRIRYLLKIGGEWVPQQLRLWHRQDIQLWMKLLQHVTTKGFPINSIFFVKPSVTLWSDACEYVIEGYSNSGLACQWRITSAWHGKLTLNLL